ncbi:hypothetical protein F400_gp128 [Bacillus phage BCD7]|uniref:Uncharacterized protein n=1 Tax=Bacillus phage BCD7 TaxID=1136534 RepID=J9PVD4_9CAUD|nr:hypothetical protein F400_gp128 [Bacillus phage BCD7]AEZ50575.1 hypothetical protein BCD7_0128 [Bacillus phage BCD7]
MERHEGSKVVAVVPNQLRKNLTFDTGLLQLMQNNNGDQLIEVSDIEMNLRTENEKWFEEALERTNEMSKRLQEGFEGLSKGAVIVLDSFSAMSPMAKMMQDIAMQMDKELIQEVTPKTRAEIERERQKERKEFHKFVNSRRGRGKRR